MFKIIIDSHLEKTPLKTEKQYYIYNLGILREFFPNIILIHIPLNQYLLNIHLLLKNLVNSNHNF